MEFAFPWPGNQGEWLAFGAAVATALLGLWHFFALLFTHFPNALAVRAQAAGLQFGAGAVAVLMAQPLVYLAIGAGWAAAVLIKIVAMARHGRADGTTLLSLILALVLAVLPLGYVFGML